MQRVRRKATVSAYALVMAPLLLLVGLLAVNTAWMVEVRTALDGSTDAAALAAARTLVDDDFLVGDSERLHALLAGARHEARKYARLNQVVGEPLELRLNPANDQNGDIVFGFLDRPRGNFVPVDSEGSDDSTPPINAVRVRGQRTRERGNPVKLLGGFPNLGRERDAHTQATAMLDGAVIGFRPIFATSAIPLAPIALRSEKGGTDKQSWEGQLAGPGVDEWSFDRGARAFIPGSDALPEITIELAPPNNKSDADEDKDQKKSPGSAFVLALGDGSIESLRRQIVAGVGRAELADYGGEFVLGSDDGLKVPGSGYAPSAGSDLDAALQDGLRALQRSGEARVWPLYAAGSEQDHSARIIGFVAARVVDVREVGEDGRLTFTLQPARMSTATAVTESDRDRPHRNGMQNPFIVKVRLVD